MSNVLSSKTSSVVHLELASMEALENVQSNFDVYTRADDNSEIIFDGVFFDDEEVLLSFLSMVGVDRNSDLGDEIVASSFVILYV